MIGLLLGALALVGGCQQKVQRPACPPGQVCLEYGNNIEPATLDPQKSNLVDEGAIISNLMMGLTTDGPDAKPQPGMAASWETSADGLTWTFHLRDASWSDGVKLTAHDFVYAYRRIVDPATASNSAYLLYVLKNAQTINEGKAPIASLGAEALDDRTLRLGLEHPAPYLLGFATHRSFYPVPRHVVERHGDDWVKPGNYVSNGAYRLASWQLGSKLQVVKNPRFFDAGNVCVDRINFYPTPDAVSAERQVQRGELDIQTNFFTNRLARINAAMPGVARTHLSLATAYVSFNTRDVAALKDVRVRRALSESIDRDFITSKLLRAGQVPAYAFVPPVISNYASGEMARPRTRWADMPFTQRQIEARALLAQAGYGPDRPLKIEIKISNVSDTILITEAIQADWRAIGVDVRLALNEGAVAFAAYRNRDFDVGAMSWYADFDDPVTFLGLLKSDTGAQNYGDYKNPAYDALLAKADLEPDGETRAKILARAEQLMLDDEAMAPLYYVVNRNLVSRRVTGWVDNAANFHRARFLCVREAGAAP